MRVRIHSMHLRMCVRILRMYLRVRAPSRRTPDPTPVGERVFGVFGPKCVDVASFRPRAPRPPIKLRFSYYGSRANADADREHAAWAAAGTAADSGRFAVDRRSEIS